jgi:hypothetical protein
MTKAEIMRAAVLTAAEQGLAEDEIAEQLGISEDRVLKILDTVEAQPRREKTAKDDVRKEPRRFRDKSFVPVNPDRNKRPRKYTPTGNPTGRPLVAAHGTKAGYDRHLFLGDTTCDACKGAVREIARKRMHDKLIPFASEEECSIYLAGVLQRMVMFRCDTYCTAWHVMHPAKVKLTPEEKKAFHKTATMRRIRRRKALDTLQLTTIG